jgi:two-component system response regulator HydG
MKTFAEKTDRQSRQKILVVDNEQVILDLLRRVLSREGYEVATTTHGDEAVGLVSTGCFDLAITEIGVHRLDGRDLMMRIKQASPETVLVAMTSYPANEVIRFAQDHADGYLEKPFALEELLRVVRRALQDGVKLSGEAAAISSTWS